MPSPWVWNEYLRVRREQLQRIAREQLARMRPLPRRLVLHDRRPLRVLEALEAVALELELARLGLQPRRNSPE